MKYVISMLLLIVYTAHAGQCSSRQQRLPKQYVYVTPTLTDNTSNETLYTGLYTFIDYSDNTLPSAQRPSRPHGDSYIVDIEKAKVSFRNPHMQKAPGIVFPLENILTITYSIKKITESHIQTIQESETATFETATFNPQVDTATVFEKIIPQLAITLKIKAERHPVFYKCAQ